MKIENIVMGFGFTAILLGGLFGIYKLVTLITTNIIIGALFTIIGLVALISILMLFNVIGEIINKKLTKIGNMIRG